MTDVYDASTRSKVMSRIRRRRRARQNESHMRAGRFSFELFSSFSIILLILLMFSIILEKMNSEEYLKSSLRKVEMITNPPIQDQ